MWIDDNLVAGASRAAVRAMLADPTSSTSDEGGATVTKITETPQERQERLRTTWGHDPAAQAQWRLR